MRRFRIKGKTYKVIKQLPNADELLVDEVYLLLDSKKEQYTLLCSPKSYILYNSKQQRVATTYSITELR